MYLLKKSVPKKSGKVKGFAEFLLSLSEEPLCEHRNEYSLEYKTRDGFAGCYNGLCATCGKGGGENTPVKGSNTENK